MKNKFNINLSEVAKWQVNRENIGNDMICDVLEITFEDGSKGIIFIHGREDMIKPDFNIELEG